MPESEVLTLYAILEDYNGAADEVEDVLNSFELAKSAFETAFSDLCDELDAVMEHLDSCRKHALRRKKMHRRYFAQEGSDHTCGDEHPA